MKTDETDTKEDTIDIAELARAHGMAAIDTLAEIMTCAATPASVRVSAAKIILDRGFGSQEWSRHRTTEIANRRYRGSKE